MFFNIKLNIYNGNTTFKRKYKIINLINSSLILGLDIKLKKWKNEFLILKVLKEKKIYLKSYNIIFIL